MEGLLSSVRTSYTSTNQEERHALVETPKPDKAPSNKPLSKATTPSDALEILRNEPDHESLILTLQYLIREDNPSFNITSPSPLGAQLVHVLVSEIVPNYWQPLIQSRNGNNPKARKERISKKSSGLELLLSCLRSVTGLNALLLGLKQLIQRSNETKKVIDSLSIHENLTIHLQVLAELIQGDETVREIANAIWNTPGAPFKQNAMLNEFLGIIGGGKILGIAAEAENVINELSKKICAKYWISDRSAYSSWLARNITHLVRSLPPECNNGWNFSSELLCRAFRLGYPEIIIKEIFISLLLQPEEYRSQFERLLDCLPNFEQRNFIQSLLKVLSRDYLSSVATSDDNSGWWHADAGIVSAASGLIRTLANDESRKNNLIAWLTSSSGAGVGDGIAIRRAVIAALAANENDIEAVLEKSLQQFGDQLYIRYTPTIQQEVHAQVVLLSAGYVHRIAPIRLAMIMRSGAYLNTVSNRLGASSPRSRFLGMVAGEALSSLVDKGGKRMDFKMEEMSTPEAKWYKSLVTVSDTVGSLGPLKRRMVAKVPQKIYLPTSKPMAKPESLQGDSKIMAIEEVGDDEGEESDNDGLILYAKPDSDEEDSDEDPTLITRNKPTAPVYIRDLIKFIRDTESYDKQKLALQTAASLIRRKANFGTEVSIHAEELATLLVGLQDKYEIENFQEMRLQGMIAVLIAQPLAMGQWFSKTFFDGDYSISQRASILTALGLGARELGGFGNEDSNVTPTKSISSNTFPSKALPEALHKLYAPSADTPVDKLSKQLSSTMIAPMAADLADKLTGPSILKVRTFSSRMAVEKARKRPIANSLAKVVSDGFFSPLTGRFFVHLKASRSNVIFQPYLLALFIKTLSLLIHASGPSTLSLPQMTSEFWDLLLSLRMQSIGDITVVEALLFAFLTILEINEDKRGLVEAHGRQLLETQEWVESVFGRVGAGGSEEDDRVRMLAAGCLVRIREVVEKYQALLMGDLVNF